MRNTALIAFGFALLLLETSLAALLPLEPWWPMLVLPIVIYLGVAPDSNLLRGAAVSFVLGYLTDALSGSSMGPYTFVIVATYMLSRAVRLRLLLRGPLFQVLMTFVVTALAGGMILALRAIFERGDDFPVMDVTTAVYRDLAPAFTTAIASPFIFAAAQRIEELSGRRRDERAVV
ncbi:MAG: rod shape-determining protein MreD [Polyangiales bacterium]|nr:rod shape-determining protein MreD [Myxococcales bacterium]